MFRMIFVGVLHIYYAVRERMDSLYYRNLTECRFESSRAIDVADERAVGLAFCEDVPYGGGFTPEGVREYVSFAYILRAGEHIVVHRFLLLGTVGTVWCVAFPNAVQKLIKGNVARAELDIDAGLALR